MHGDFEIVGVWGREIPGAQENPVVEIEIRLAGGAAGRAVVSPPALVDSYAAVVLNNEVGSHYGLEAKRTVLYVNTILAEILLYEDAFDQIHIAEILWQAKEKGKKSHAQINALLSASLAVTRACAAQMRQPLYH